MPPKTLKKYHHIRFLGAEGIGMSALIRILEKQDASIQISKSDLSYKQNDPLSNDIDLVIRSTAISETDPDYIELKKRGVPIWHRRDMLNYLSESFKQIVVSGTHGKTTCSAMLSHILVEAGLDPSFAVGGILANYQSNARAGQGEYFVLEGDESDKSFTITDPYLAIVTCIEPDHLENYPGGIDEIRDCFYAFLDKAPIKVINIDDPLLAKYAESRKPEAESSIIIYSSSELSAYNIKLSMPGKHNKMNALACIKAAEQLGIKTETAVTFLESFTGIKRRFELINPLYRNLFGKLPDARHASSEDTELTKTSMSSPRSEHNNADGTSRIGCKVYDDYAHHPTEVKAVLEGALSLNPKKLVFVYQPHHPERTKQLWNEFVEVFKTFPEPHLCLIADIYVARSKHIEGINSERMVKEINKANVRYLAPASGIQTTVQGNYANIAELLKPGIDAELNNCDYLFIVGAGDIAKVAGKFKD